MALCQGAGKHFVDVARGSPSQNGVKDFDVWSFLRGNPRRALPGGQAQPPRKRQLDGRTGFEVGDAAALYDLQDRSRLLRPRLQITIIQPGVSANRVSDSQLELLASTELYVQETASASLRVITSP